MEKEIIEEQSKLYRIEENENEDYIKEDKRYDLQSCNEFVPAKDKAIVDYGWLEFGTEEQAIQHFELSYGPMEQKNEESLG